MHSRLTRAALAAASLLIVATGAAKAEPVDLHDQIRVPMLVSDLEPQVASLQVKATLHGRRNLSCQFQGKPTLTDVRTHRTYPLVLDRSGAQAHSATVPAGRYTFSGRALSAGCSLELHSEGT